MPPEKKDKLLQVLEALPAEIHDELKEWFIEKIFKINKVVGSVFLNRVPYVKRRHVVWVNFGVNIGNELKGSHPAIVLYAKDTRGTVVVVPLTSKDHDYEFYVDIGEVAGMEGYSIAVVEQVTTVSKLRIQTKMNKKENKRYYNYNRETDTFNDPTATVDQVALVDAKIEEWKTKSAQI